MKNNLTTTGLAASALLALALAGALPGRSPAVAQESAPASVAGAMSQVDEAALRAAFKEGNAQMEAKSYPQALAAYKRALALLPGDSTLLWNGGTAAFLARDYASALGLWKRLKKQDPQDGAVRAKLIQTYAALKKKPEREAERSQLFALRAQARKKNPQSPALKEKKYCRDQFSASGRSVLAYEFFALEGERARRYQFIVLKKGEEKDIEDFHLSLGSYASTNAFAQEMNAAKGAKSGRLFHLDGYYAKGVHRTFGFYDREPTYDQTRALVEAVLAGRKPTISSSQRAR